jgi:SAM-dependent methyltransferase
MYTPLATLVENLGLLGDESRLRLCVLLFERELCVNDLVRITGLGQSRVSTHLGKLREAGMVFDRRAGAQAFYSLDRSRLPRALQMVIESARGSDDPVLSADRKRLLDLEREPDGERDSDLERDYSPGRSWRSLAHGLAPLLSLGDVLDVGSGDGSAALTLASRCRSLTCVDVQERAVELAKARLAAFPHARAQVADVHALPFADASFDVVLLFHTLTYAERPPTAIQECARVLRRTGRLVLLCLAAHAHHEVTARYGERHPGFSPPAIGVLLESAGLRIEGTEIVSRELKKPHLEVVRAVAQRP